MQIKVTEKSTGIYKETTREFSLEKGDRIYLQDTRQQAAEYNIHRELDRLEKWAKETLKDHGISPGRQTRKVRIGKMGVYSLHWPGRGLPFPPDASTVRPVHLILDTQLLRDMLKELERENPKFVTELRHVAVDAYRLGRLAEKVKVSPFERDVKLGAKRRPILIKGNVTQRAEREAMYPRWQAVGNELRAKNRNRSWTDILKEVKDEHFPEDGLSTIRTHTTDPRKVKRSTVRPA